MRVVQIGTGGWGKNHTRILSQLGVLVAVCDLEKERREKIQKDYAVKGYQTVEELIENEEFDTAFVCTPTITHKDITEILLKEKKNVFVEKPLTYKSQEGEELEKLANKNNVLLTCGYIERFNPAVDVVKDFVKSNKYGELLMLEFHRENRMPLHIKDVGIIYDTAVHDIDTAMWLFDDTPQVVYARAGSIKHEHEDFATIMLGFKENKTAIISSNWITPTRVRNFNAVCTEGIIFSDFITQEVTIETKDNSEKPRKQMEEPLLLEIQNFLNAVMKKDELRVKPQHAVNVTKIAEAALLSSKKGVPIYIDLR